jgi:hypothetical protein
MQNVPIHNYVHTKSGQRVQLDHMVIIELYNMPYENHLDCKDMIKWCIENVGLGNYRVTKIDFDRVLVVQFVHETDAMQFALTWSMI